MEILCARNGSPRNRSLGQIIFCKANVLSDPRTVEKGAVKKSLLFLRGSIFGTKDLFSLFLQCFQENAFFLSLHFSAVSNILFTLQTSLFYTTLTAMGTQNNPDFFNDILSIYYFKTLDFSHRTTIPIVLEKFKYRMYCRSNTL